MLLPSHLRPAHLGLRWGKSQPECLAALGREPTRQTPHHAVVPLVLGGEAAEVTFYFDDRGQLWRVAAHLHVSRDFWEYFDGYYEEMERVSEKYCTIY